MFGKARKVLNKTHENSALGNFRAFCLADFVGRAALCRPGRPQAQLGGRLRAPEGAGPRRGLPPPPSPQAAPSRRRYIKNASGEPSCAFGSGIS